MFQALFRTSVSSWIDWSPYGQNFPECAAPVIEIMIFRKIKIKRDGGCYKLFYLRLSVIFFENFSRLIGPQKGSSISSLWVEKYALQVTHVITYFLLGVRLKRGTNFKDLPSKSWVFRSEIGFRLDINNQIDINQFFINSVHAWSWWQIISWRSYFNNVFVHCDLFDSDFQISKSNLCRIIINSFTVCVQLSHSPFSRKSVYQHRKHVCVSFIQVLSKDFESYSLAASREWLLYNTGVTCESLKSWNREKSFALLRSRSANDFSMF